MEFALMQDVDVNMDGKVMIALKKLKKKKKNVQIIAVIKELAETENVIA